MFRLKVRHYGSDVKEIALESGHEYTFGRGADCSLQLEDHPGISRVHFKVFEQDGGWVAQVVSKFGDLNLAGNPVQSVKLDNGSVFKLSGYDFLFFEKAQTVSQMSSQVSSSAAAQENQDSSEMPMAVGQSEVRSQAHLPALQVAAFEGSDEATKVMEIAAVGDPYVRIVESTGREETVKLEGRKWIAGREDGSQILLNDRKASRRQFELVSSPQGNFVRDLGSSNGTQLNGMPLAADELKPLKSGDVIQVGALQIYFEMRDPHFERRLQVVPRNVLESQLPQAQPIAYEMINYPVAQGPGGAVRLNTAGVPSVYEAPAWDLARDAQAAKTKKFRFVLICAIVAIGVGYLFTNSTPDKKPQKASQSTSPQEQAYAKLSPQKQQYVQEAYILGHNLYIQGKLALASEQFKKIHDLLKDGYKDSLALADECQKAAEQAANLAEVQRQMAEAAQNKVIVIENLAKCKPIALRSFDESELRTCLAPTYERDPENPEISDDLHLIQERVALRDAKNASSRAYAQKVARGRELFKKAQDIEKRGDNDGAVDAYKAHLASNMPDPENLRAISKSKVGVIEKNKAASIATYLSAAETAFVNKDYKTAINNINKAKGLDPYSQQAAELNGRINREKDATLRGIYEESILNEGLGQVDQAKANWKKILDMDHPDGIYYKRAKSKMKSLGGL